MLRFLVHLRSYCIRLPGKKIWKQYRYPKTTSRTLLNSSSTEILIRLIYHKDTKYAIKKAYLPTSYMPLHPYRTSNHQAFHLRTCQPGPV